MPLPGWDSLASTSAYAKLFTYLGWIALFSLGLFEIAAHVYSEHEKTLTSDDTERTITDLKKRAEGRKLNREQIESLSALLDASKIKYVGIYVVGQDPDTMRITEQISEGLKGAHWTFAGWSVMAGSLAGIEISYRNGSNKEVVDAASLLVSSLVSVGLAASLDKPFPETNSLPAPLSGPSWSETVGGEIRMFVGAKP
jgi:hypothetical protein